jgi:ABC-type multidrug transport system ATPase subunit/ABC-type multidrug transport system permease subunit
MSIFPEILANFNVLFTTPLEMETYVIPDEVTDTQSGQTRIDAIDLKLVSKKRVVLLNNISLSIPAGSLVAIVGSSGSGKSTLINTLTGFRIAQSGKILYNGHNFYQHASTFREQLGYVPQDDIVHPGLTVERALYYAAKMRLPAKYTRQQLQERIDAVLQAVELTERRTLLISKLSGGQRKRVSIALELLETPEIFFLDEPTSGLDPGLDYKMMHLLRSLADKGQTTVVSTHATSNIMICDYICFLAPGGHLAYFGPPEKALAFFQKETFAHIYPILDTSTEHPNAPAEAAERFKNSEDYQRYISEPLAQQKEVTKRFSKRRTQKKRHNGLTQFILLSLRYLELLKNDVGSLLILLLQAPVIALLLVALMKYGIGTTMFTQQDIASCPTNATVFLPNGLPDRPMIGHAIYSNSCTRVEHILNNTPQGKAYAQKRGGVGKALQDFIVNGSGINAQKILFIMSFTAVLFGCVNAVREIVKEGPIYRRERAVHLGILPYIFSKIVVLGILSLVQDAILLLVVNAIAPFATQGILLPTLPELYITLVLTSLSGLMIGLVISAAAPTTDRAMNFIPLILIPQVIFSGIIFPFKSRVIQIIAMAFTSRWSIGALGSTIGLHALSGDSLIDHHTIYCGTRFSICSHATAITHLLCLWGALIAMTLFAGCIACLILKSKDIP